MRIQGSNYFDELGKKWNLEPIYDPLKHFDCGGVGKED